MILRALIAIKRKSKWMRFRRQCSLRNHSIRLNKKCLPQKTKRNYWAHAVRSIGGLLLETIEWKSKLSFAKLLSLLDSANMESLVTLLMVIMSSNRRSTFPTATKLSFVSSMRTTFTASMAKDASSFTTRVFWVSIDKYSKIQNTL